MPKKPATLPNLRRLFGSIAALMAAVFLSACASDLAATRPSCTWELWQGNPEKEGITRLSSLAPVSCKDPRFAGYTCLTADDLKNLMECGGK